MSANRANTPLTRLALHQETLRRVVYVPLLAMFALSVILVLLINNLMSTVESVEHSDKVILKATQLLKLAVDAQSAKRGFFVKIDPRFFKTYESVTEQIPRRFSELISETQDNTRQAKRVKTIWEAYKIWKTDSDLDIENRRKQGNKLPPQAITVYGLDGNVLMNNLRETFDAFLEEEDNLRQQRSDNVQQTTTNTLIGAGVLLAFVGGLLGLWTRRQMGQLTRLYGSALNEEQQVSARFSTTLLGIGDAVLVTDADGKITLMNTVAEALTGWNTDEAQGQPVTTIFATFQEGTGLPVKNPVERALQEGMIIQLDRNTLLRQRAGTMVAIDDSAAPLKDAQGVLTGAVLVFRDVTAQRQYETVREILSERLQLATEGSATGIWDYDLETQTVVFDTQARALFGIAPDSDFSHDLVLEAVHPDDRPERDRQIAGAQDPNGNGSYSVEIRVTGVEDGVYRHLLVRGSAFFDAERTKAIRLAGTLQDITERKRLEAERDALLARQSRVAETLQQSMLLTPPEKAFPGISVATLYKAAWEEADVGGDFHDTFSFWPNRVAMVIGDVTGKGLEAAAYTAEAKYALRAFLHENPLPSLALARLNDYLVSEQRHTESSPARQSDSLPLRFVSIGIAIVNTETGEVDCVSGGAEPPFLLRSSTHEIEEVPARGLVVGAAKGTRYKAIRLQMEPGDVLFFTTDGITEARNRDREFFADTELTTAFREALQSTDSLQDAANIIVQRAQAFAGGRLRDDACLMLVRRDPSV